MAKRLPRIKLYIKKPYGKDVEKFEKNVIGYFHLNII